MIEMPVMFMLAAVFGLLFGLIYFIWLWRSVASLASSKQAPAGVVLNAGLRLATIAALVGVLLWLEIAPLLLLAGGLGFFAARVAATFVLLRPANER